MLVGIMQYWDGESGLIALKKESTTFWGSKSCREHDFSEAYPVSFAAFPILQEELDLVKIGKVKTRISRNMSDGISMSFVLSSLNISRNNTGKKLFLIGRK
jgi:hypothetical protein